MDAQLSTATIEGCDRRILPVASILATFLFYGLLVASIACAEDTPATLDLRAGHFSKLEKEFSAVQHSYETGIIDDHDLLVAFRAFYPIDPALESRYSLWIHKYPKSYVAHLARGIYYKSIGLDIRGEDFIDKVPEASLRQMDAKFQLAWADLSDSISLTHKPLLSYQHLLGIEQRYSNRFSQRRLLSLALAIDPKSSIVRRRYLDSLQTRWGGSVAKMRDFVNECERANLPDKLIREFKAATAADEGWVQEHANNFAAAEKAYLSAIALNDENWPLWERIGYAQVWQKKYSEAVSSYSTFLAFNPNAAPALNNRAHAYYMLQQPQLAAIDYRKAADLGSGYGQNELGKLYWFGRGVPIDKTLAIKYFRMAADGGGEEAKRNLMWALKLTGQSSPAAASPTPQNIAAPPGK